jgi:hypothetical protein
MAAVGHVLTQARHPKHDSSFSMHSAQIFFARIPKQASGFATFTFLPWGSKTDAGQT